MKHLLILMLVLQTSATVRGQDPLDATLVRPEAVLQAQDQIGLTVKQRQALQKIVQDAGPRINRLEQEAARAKQQLVQALGKRDANEADLEALVSTFLKLERQKQELTILTRVRLGRELSEEQFRRAQQISLSMIKQGTNGPQGPTMLRQTVGPREPRQLPGTSIDPKPFELLREEILAMRSADVPWRKVQWKTCLLEGLNESKRTNKPLMLWVFIDRPVDDERC